jgi:hypothetical protein
MKYKMLQIESADQLVFGTAPYPVTTRRGLILAPVIVIEICREIVKGVNYIDATVKGCLKGLDIIVEALAGGQLKKDEREEIWIDSIRQELRSIPVDEDAFVEDILPTIDRDKILLEEYGL